MSHRIPPQIQKQLEPFGRLGIAQVSLAAVVASYQGGPSPKHIIGKVDDTMVSLRSYRHDRLDNYLEGLLTERQKIEFIEADFGAPKERWRKWQHKLPEKFAQMWGFMQSDTKLMTYLMILEQEIKDDG